MFGISPRSTGASIATMISCDSIGPGGGSVLDHSGGDTVGVTLAPRARQLHG